MGNSEAQGCHFLLRHFKESLVLIQPKWQHRRPKSLISPQKQAISLQILISPTSTLVFYPHAFILGREQNFRSRGDTSISCLYTKLSLSASNQVPGPVFLKYTGDGDWDGNQQSATQKQPETLCGNKSQTVLVQKAPESGTLRAKSFSC